MYFNEFKVNFNSDVVALLSLRRSKKVNKLIGMIFLLAGVSTIAMASPVPSAPEIDPGSFSTALALIGGAWMVVRGRRKA